MIAHHNVSTQSFKSPIGELIIGSYKDKLCLCDWRYRRMRTRIDKRIQSSLNATYIEQNSSVIEHAIAVLRAYFANELTQFELPLLMLGTPFQQNVWSALLDIPYGKTNSYIDLARNIQNEKAVRAVASANGANAISIIIPCHRVIGCKGELTGYAGGLPAKKRLLALEQL
ncbi:MAG: cysteine methyltransferase [Cycloclasticus sp. symbiont of Bathymodiolus heckerae]|nr:MAG: cysteine methyltransferase [Cycloclasticus sp. symbiont of Bathymodiolus heckerae]